MRRILPLLLVPLSFTSLAAQQEPTIAPGDRVRVTAPTIEADALVGTVAALDTSGLFLVVQTGQPALVIPLASVTALEVSRGRKSKVWLGAGVGFLVGATTGAILGAASGDNDAFTSEDLALGGAIILGVPGALIGALVGLAIKTERWDTVPLTSLRITLAPITADGFGATLRVSLPR